MAVTIINQYPDYKLSHQKAIKDWVVKVVALHKQKVGQLNFVLMSDTDLLDYNKKHLKHNFFTDIITYNYCEGNKVSGDILISIDRVADNAYVYKVSFQEELMRVMIHGVLHLCGFDDKTVKARKEMKKMEDKALALA